MGYPCLHAWTLRAMFIPQSSGDAVKYLFALIVVPACIATVIAMTQVDLFAGTFVRYMRKIS